MSNAGVSHNDQKLKKRDYTISCLVRKQGRQHNIPTQDGEHGNHISHSRVHQKKQVPFIHKQNTDLNMKRNRNKSINEALYRSVFTQTWNLVIYGRMNINWLQYRYLSLWNMMSCLFDQGEVKSSDNKIRNNYKPVIKCFHSSEELNVVNPRRVYV
jgi:hypothetical protein